MNKKLKSNFLNIYSGIRHQDGIVYLLPFTNFSFYHNLQGEPHPCGSPNVLKTM